MGVAAGVVAADWNPPFHRVWRWGATATVSGHVLFLSFFDILATVGDWAVFYGEADSDPPAPFVRVLRQGAVAAVRKALGLRGKELVEAAFWRKHNAASPRLI